MPVVFTLAILGIIKLWQQKIPVLTPRTGLWLSPSIGYGFVAITFDRFLNNFYVLSPSQE
ncbi:MAG: hypothetical protein QQW96_03325 [Tychonema bourrellyi B0820]|uniref:hypothetical protein n=1 Tax=Tychonema bourrellyi TaxID=54313 RepID=UPI001180D6F5|nr:hypothetical protein [Tychonema bourrellyi]MDQ2096662.1 hypothetical protein [Tychonema bourrellyi B0820]